MTKHAASLATPSIAAVFVAALAGPMAPNATAQLAVVSVEPGINASHVAPAADIIVHFDRPVAVTALPPTTDHLKVFGKSTGPASGTWTVDATGLSARFTPAEAFSAGEMVQVDLSHDLLAVDGTALRSAGYHFEYRVRTRPNTLEFTQIATMSVRSQPSQGVRVYGGQASDLNDDGWLDLAIVNQGPSDVRVLLNQADGTGSFDPFLTPTTGTGNTPSPNESCDMDGDGLMDIVTGDKIGDTVSVLLGRGDGTFDPSVQYAMGDLPRGVAVFDMDGDGDTDVVSANANSSSLSLRMNNGDGTLGPATTMDGGGDREWGLASGDMNNDGIIDFVVGAQGSERLIVWLGNGDGTFSQGGSLNGVNRVWMVVLGDVNGDGNLDVSTGNGVNASGTIALGDGNGNLTLHQVLPTGGLVVATDLGDLDGDGDLDWILSAFSGSVWGVFENDGTGTFTHAYDFAATDNPACALLFDFDRDQDLDLALLDEIADEFVFLENTCPASNFCPGIANSTGVPATTSFTGSSSVAVNELNVHAGPLPDGFGFYFYGQNTQFPMSVGNGILCLGGPVYRSSPALATGSLLTVSFDLTSPPVAGATILPGSTWHFQCVYRDAAAGGANFNFSDGLTLTFL